jgi:hypothetical protein
MFYDDNGPIQEFSWGKFVISGQEHSKSGEMKKGFGKDIRLIGTEVSKWKERKGHLLTDEMITGVFERNIETLIIGIGASGALHCPPSVQEYIKSKGIPELVLVRTPDACKVYNEMYRSGQQVALLAHGTC